jgi:CRISPR/Cas system CMR subunit Cmr6 (Cas7 group RAMP superfamily)
MLVNLPNLNFYKEKQLKTLQQEFEFKAKKIVLDKIKHELKKQIHSLKILKKTLDAIRTDFQTRARLQSILKRKQIEFRDYFLAYNLFRGKQLYLIFELKYSI